MRIGGVSKARSSEPSQLSLRFQEIAACLLSDDVWRFRVVAFSHLSGEEAYGVFFLILGLIKKNNDRVYRKFRYAICNTNSFPH